MTSTRRDTGRDGESIAAAWLERNGFRILARNVHLRHAELDLVAIEGDVLCIIEVRRRRTHRFGGAAESVGPAKQRRIVRATRELLARRTPPLPRFETLRFDVVALEPDGHLHLYRNAFTA